MTRTDVIKAAVIDMLERYRSLLDSGAPVKSIKLDVKIASDNRVRAMLLTPEIEVLNGATHRINDYSFR
jgi:hypothetical protein